MNTAPNSSTGHSANGRLRRWLLEFPRAVPIAIFVAIAAATLLSVFTIESNARQREKAQLREFAQSVAFSLDRLGSSSTSYLRAGAALFANAQTVSPELFRQFGAESRLDTEFRRAEAIGWVETVTPDGAADHLARMNAEPSRNVERIWPQSTEPNAAMAPVTYLLPETKRNRRALGFDMYSDPVRSAAMDESKRLLKPIASAKVVLAQEGAGDAPGFLIFMPVYDNRTTGQELRGYIYSAFDGQQFLDAAIEIGSEADIGAKLYDGEAEPENLLADREVENASGHHLLLQVEVADRSFLLVVEGTAGGALAPLSIVSLLFGLAVASLLMLLARLLAQQAAEDRAKLVYFEEQNSIRNSLTRELNHRVKNTLANVLSILSLTRRRASDINEFANSLDGRIRALSATHDLLTQSDWGTTPVADVIRAEMAHFQEANDHEVRLDGPRVELAPNDALTFGLAIHELGTNAAKYGSLSREGGSVSIQWSLESPDLAIVEWKESGGPKVCKPEGLGFGIELIQKIVTHELKHPVQLEFPADGVRCVLRVPVRRKNEFRVRGTEQQ
ncbi:MAG: CHASE domain-containing protein [Erythrobacter sp.]